MSDWDRLSDLMATLAAASLAWVSAVLGPDLPVDATGTAGPAAQSVNRHGLMIAWAQPVEEPPIEQTGEDTEDVETLDEAPPQTDEVAPAEDVAPPAEEVTPAEEAVPPAEDVAPEEDVETLDQGSPPAAEEDIELLDQGSPPVTTGAPITEPTAPAAVAAAPVTTDVVSQPVAPSGPVVPEGFGTGNVHVSAGSAEFPVGLADCHVGAVTGRAYVGIDCGDGSSGDGSSFVGHAPSFEEFPFVVDEGFPFNREGVFDVLVEDAVTDDADVFVAAAREDFFGDDTTAPEIRTSGASSVEFAQEARQRKPRVEADSRSSKDSKPSKDPNKGENGEVRASARDDGDERTRGEAKSKKRGRDKDEKSRVDAGGKEKKSKKQGGKKGNKGRQTRNR